MGPSQLEYINEIHIRNPNYKGKTMIRTTKPRKPKLINSNSSFQQTVGTSTRLPITSQQPATTLAT